MKKETRYIFILAVALIGLFVLEYFTPKPLDWRITLSKQDKIPYGTFLLYESLTNIFPKEEILTNDLSLYEALYTQEIDSAFNGNFIFISEDFSPNELDYKALMHWINNGANALIISSSVQYNLADTFHLNIAYTSDYIGYYSSQQNQRTDRSSLGINFVSKQLHRDSAYYFQRGTVGNYFYNYDTLATQILGTTTNEEVNFIKLKYGKGNIFLHANPLIFTNYNLLALKNEAYISHVIAHLPPQKTIWDQYYKSNKIGSMSPMRYILLQPSLRWAYYTFIVTLILLVIFGGKRKQRVIPVIKAPTNTTLEFVATIGTLYFQNADHKNLAIKMITFLKEDIRKKYYLSTSEITPEFIELLSVKSSRPNKEVTKLFTLIQEIELQEVISEQKLHELHKCIAIFWNKK